jgi:hypothetical protein
MKYLQFFFCILYVIMELELSHSVKYYIENVLEEGAEFIIWG